MDSKCDHPPANDLVNDDNLSNKHNKAVNNNKHRYSLFLGLLAFGFGLLFGGFYLPVIAIALGVFGVILALWDFKKTNKVFYMGLILGLLGASMGGLAYYSSFVNQKIAQEADQVYSEILAINLPDIDPDFYFVAFGIFASIDDLPRKEFHYSLSENDNEAFNSQISSDNRWNSLPFSQTLAAFLTNFNLDFEYVGEYLLYDRINDQFGELTDLENYQKEYNFVLIIYDYEAQVLVLYDIYKS
ncbi:MAG: hypothetical protein AB7T03_00435 [Bacilli bacterium]